jgi:hypothetical protein
MLSPRAVLDGAVLLVRVNERVKECSLEKDRPVIACSRSNSAVIVLTRVTRGS